MQSEYMFQLLKQMKDGDQQAFHAMYDATYQDVYRTVSFLVDHAQDREDVMNEIYMQMWTSLANYDTNRPFHFWLHGLVIRQVQRFRVKRWRRFRIFERIRDFAREESHWDQPSVLMDGTNQMISQAIHKLTDKQRTVIILRFFHDYTLEEIATLLDIPLGTVKSRYHAGIQALRKNIWNLPRKGWKRSMTIERKIREHLRKEAETMDCPQAISNRIEQSYTQYLQRQRSGKTMKKRFIAGIIATAILIPTAAFAAPTLIDMLTRTPMTAEQVKTDEIGKATLEKLYRAFPETKKFEIIDASTVQGVQTSIILQEKGGTGKKITLHTNSMTGEIEHVIQENWEPKEKPLTALTEQEIKSKVDHLIIALYGSIEAYEFAMEPMENPDQKTLMLNYIQKGSTAPFYQVLVQDHSISLSLIGGETSSSDNKVQGFFTTNGKPDYFADAFLNDDKLFPY